jgi:hypothetical protein
VPVLAGCPLTHRANHPRIKHTLSPHTTEGALTPTATVAMAEDGKARKVRRQQAWGVRAHSRSRPHECSRSRTRTHACALALTFTRTFGCARDHHARTLTLALSHACACARLHAHARTHYPPRSLQAVAGARPRVCSRCTALTKVRLCVWVF